MTFRHTLFLTISLLFSSLVIADFREGGNAYIRGDYETAAKEFKPLAERGDHRAMYALGSLYAAGLGVEKDLKKSFELFSEAAQNGRADAMFKLGLMYESGEGTKKNIKKALRYYQKSAKKGYPMAQYRFGLMYKNGTGVKQNPVNAYAWMVIAGHYFIYETALATQLEEESVIDQKNQLLLFQQQEKDRVFGEIIQHLQSLKNDMSDNDIEATRNKVIKLSKYRKKYHSEKIKKLQIEPDINNLFLPETLY